MSTSGAVADAGLRGQGQADPAAKIDTWSRLRKCCKVLQKYAIALMALMTQALGLPAIAASANADAAMSFSVTQVMKALSTWLTDCINAAAAHVRTPEGQIIAALGMCACCVLVLRGASASAEFGRPVDTTPSAKAAQHAFPGATPPPGASFAAHVGIRPKAAPATAASLAAAATAGEYTTSARLDTGSTRERDVDPLEAARLREATSARAAEAVAAARAFESSQAALSSGAIKAERVARIKAAVTARASAAVASARASESAQAALTIGDLKAAYIAEFGEPARPEPRRFASASETAERKAGALEASDAARFAEPVAVSDAAEAVTSAPPTTGQADTQSAIDDSAIDDYYPEPPAVLVVAAAVREKVLGSVVPVFTRRLGAPVNASTKQPQPGRVMSVDARGLGSPAGWSQPDMQATNLSLWLLAAPIAPLLSSKKSRKAGLPTWQAPTVRLRADPVTSLRDITRPVARYGWDPVAQIPLVRVPTDHSKYDPWVQLHRVMPPTSQRARAYALHASSAARAARTEEVQESAKQLARATA